MAYMQQTILNRAKTAGCKSSKQYQVEASQRQGEIHKQMAGVEQHWLGERLNIQEQANLPLHLHWPPMLQSCGML